MTEPITRARWGARPPRGARNALDPNPKGVAVHWNGPGCAAALRSHDKCPGFLRGIQDFHMGPQRGWGDIAYSLFACPHGGLFEGRGKGIGTAANGTSFGNRYYYAIYAMWGEGDGPVPEALLDGITEGVALCRSWGAGSEVTYHGRFLSTSCPGPELTSLVKAGRFNRKTAATAPTPAPEKDWFDMATENDLRKIIREELARVPAAVWGHRITLNDEDRTALRGSVLESISTAGLLKTGVRLQARQSTADAVLREVRE